VNLWGILPWALLLLVLVPLGLLTAIGLAILALKIVAIVQKAGEPPTVDRGGHYSLEQGKEVGKGPDAGGPT
jgi:hypothetical protein